MDGALLALASGKAERRQVHPLREHQSITSHGFHRYAQIFFAGIPSYENSHRLHGCAQIRRQKRNLKICEYL